MMSILDEEQIIKSFIRSERYDAEQASLKKSALAMIKLGKIAVEEIKAEVIQLA